MSTSNRPMPLRAEHYEAIEQTLLDSAPGRWFLAEYARRNRNADTQLLLEAIGRIESSLQPPQRSVDLIRRDLTEMSEAIARTRVEIASIKGPNGGAHGQMSATEELDAIVTATERATSIILAAAESLQEALWWLKKDPNLKQLHEAIQNNLTEIVTACSFQDITGQRIHKVVQVLRFLESRVNSIIDIWDIDGGEIEEALAPEASAETHLLDGPPNADDALAQADIDSIIDTIDELEPAGEKTPRPERVEIDEEEDDLIFADVEDGAEHNAPAPPARPSILFPGLTLDDLDPVKREALFS